MLELLHALVRDVLAAKEAEGGEGCQVPELFQALVRDITVE